MSQDRRKPTQSQAHKKRLQEKPAIAEPGERVRLELLPVALTKPARRRSDHLAALLQLLNHNGIDCSILVEGADEAPRSLH